jgi:hypothetical protein
MEAVTHSDVGQTQRLIQEGASANSRREDVYEIADLTDNCRARIGWETKRVDDRV